MSATPLAPWRFRDAKRAANDLVPAIAFALGVSDDLEAVKPELRIVAAIPSDVIVSPSEDLFAANEVTRHR